MFNTRVFSTIISKAITWFISFHCQAKHPSSGNGDRTPKPPFPMRDKQSDLFAEQEGALEASYDGGFVNQIVCARWESVISKIPRVDLVFTSPPYNIGKKADNSKLGRRGEAYDAVSWAGVRGYEDAMPEPEYQASQRQLLEACAGVLKPSGSVVYNHKERQRGLAAIRPSDWFPSHLLAHRQTIIWDRETTHNHDKSYLYPTIEWLYWLTHASSFRKRAWFRNEGFGQVWRIPKETSANPHPAPFPLELARRVVRLFCPPKGIVFDPHMGSGTTALAALMEGRRFIGTEAKPEFVEMANARLTAYRETERKEPRRKRKAA